MNSLTTTFAMGVQSDKDTLETDAQAFVATSVNGNPDFDMIENQNQMVGIHERATAQQSVPERTGISVPLSWEFGLYPRSLGVALSGIGFVEDTPVLKGGTGVYVHKFVKSNQSDAPQATAYIKMGSSANSFSRQVDAVRMSQMEWTLNRQGAMASAEGLGLNERRVANAPVDYTVNPEVLSMIMPFTGNIEWVSVDDPLTTAYNFGCAREETITFDREIETDDQCLHDYQRNDNQELSFALSGAARGIDFSEEFYRYLVYGGIANITPGRATILTGMKMRWETSALISGEDQAYRLLMYVRKAEVRLANFRAQGNSVIRADMSWRMIDDDTEPPVSVQLENDVLYANAFPTRFASAGGDEIADWDTSLWTDIVPAFDSLTGVINETEPVVDVPVRVSLTALDQFGDVYTGSEVDGITPNIVFVGDGTIDPTTISMTNGEGYADVTFDTVGTDYQISVTIGGETWTSDLFDVVAA
jgi:hypothetical protein